MANNTVYNSSKYIFFAYQAAELFKLSRENQLKIIDRINEGYLRNNEKFNIMKGKRIEDPESFNLSLGFPIDSSSCYLYLFLEKSETFDMDLSNCKSMKREIFQGYEFYFPRKADESFLKFNSLDIKGILGFKPHHSYPNGKTIEPTSFTTFSPKLGSLMLPMLEKHYATLFEVDNYIVEVIVEHKLCEYYSNHHNYAEIKRFVVPVDYKSDESEIIPGLILNKPMTISVMIKNHDSAI
ncbi:hypothetical protein QEN19_002302 [Hanseniaspora menglaensis]